MGTLRIAWRSIWRNGRRTAITVAAVGMSTLIMVVTFGLMDGMRIDMVHNVTHLVLGDVQVHATGYRADQSFYKAVPEPEAILDAARAAGVHAAPRAYGYGLVSVGHKSAGARFWGVEPAAERAAFDLAGKLAQGSFLSDSAEASRASRELVLGRKLARSLHAELGSEIIAVVQAADGSLGNELFTVVGILVSCGEDMDRSAAIIHARDFELLFVSGGRIHEIALNARGTVSPERVAARLEAAVTGKAELEEKKPEKEAGGVDIETWRELNPALSDMERLFGASMWLFSLIFFLAAGLGVMNTMLMATFERIREFGVLKALGSTPWRILRDVATESFVLGLFASLLGAVLGAACNLYLAHAGIDLSRYGDVFVEGVAFSPIWRAAASVEGIAAPSAVMVVVCVLAALYPAAKAARLDPVRAMTHV
ncbi:MAG: ABC transporter permease [Deltaproteobacteria bacterium]|nr:ABC transporter permease [Deltaproteobacteria bacterium]